MLKIIFRIVAIVVIVYFLFKIFNTFKEDLDSKKFENLPKLKIGDVIFREGIGTDSSVIKALSNSEYSHIGLIINVEPLEILHATTNDRENMQNQVIISDFAEFSKIAKNIAIKRYDINDDVRENIKKDSIKYIAKPFVLAAKQDSIDSKNHNISQDSIESKKSREVLLNENSNILYCTTLLEDILSKYIHLNIYYSYVALSLFQGYYLFPKAFLDDEDSIFIYKSN